MRNTLLILIALALCSVNCHTGFVDTHPWSSSFDSSSYERGEALSPNYLLFWTANKNTKIIKFAAVVKTAGWVGLGLSDNGGMKGADIALLLPSPDGIFDIEDRFSSDFMTPELDASQDKTIVYEETNQENGVTSFVFYRSFESCDKAQDRDIIDGQQWVIFAFGSSATFYKHAAANRGQKLISLITPSPQTPLPSDVLTLDVLSPEFLLPAVETTFACFSAVLPSDRKYHVVKIEPLVTNTNVHHINLFQCPMDLNISNPQVCQSEVSHACDQLWYGWAKGEAIFNTPLEAGFPMGSGDGGSNAHYLLIEIHYENPQLLEGTKDSGSGFRFYYTPTLRANDIGIVIFGDYEFMIPANEFGYTLANRCPGQCTQRIPPEGINILYTRFHMHTYGYSANLTQIRDGTELAPLAIMRRYDYTLQNCVASPPGAKILPGDNIITYCQWDTTGKQELTQWGVGAADEMCRAFVYYYPRINIGSCHYTQSLDKTRCSQAATASSDPADYVDAEPMPSYIPYQDTCTDPTQLNEPQTVNPPPLPVLEPAVEVVKPVVEVVQPAEEVVKPVFEVTEPAVVEGEPKPLETVQQTQNIGANVEPSQSVQNLVVGSPVGSSSTFDLCASRSSCSTCIAASSCIYCSIAGFTNTGVCYDVSIKNIEAKCDRLGGKILSSCGQRVRPSV